MHQGIYECLLELARGDDLTTYSRIAPLAGLSMDVAADRDTMSRLLSEIAMSEHGAGRPMLTALVVHSGQDNNPGEGFFSLAHQIDRYSGSRDPLSRLQFWVLQVQEVREYWRSPRFD